jgi:N-acetylmuramoyl-L-alanine amidase
VSVQLTRDRDTAVSLAERARLVRASGARVFLSLHANSGQPADSGTETWVHPQAGPRSHALATAVRGRLARLGGRDRGLFAGDLHLLRPALQA